MSSRPPRKNLKYYIAELIILVLGISLSFLLNEWRTTKSDRRTEKEMLLQFRDNLVADSTQLSGGIDGLDFMIDASNDLLALEAGETYTDSVTMNLIRILNFTGFYATDIAYQEMRSLGHSRMIRNKDLLKGLIKLYESDYDLVKEWVSADRAFMMNDMLPHMNQTLPFAKGLNFPGLTARKKRELMDRLNEDHTKYVIQSGQIMKQGTQVVFEGVLKEVRSILELLEEELGD